MARFSSNALTKRWAEEQGWLCSTVQQYYGRRRHDLFGIGDSLIIRSDAAAPILAQNCSYGSLKPHRDLIDQSPLRERLVGHLTLCLVEWRRRKAKRGGKRMARGWWLRTQTAQPGGQWGELTDWIGPVLT